MLISVIFTSCGHFEYSPDQIFDHDSYQDINAINLKKLGTGINDDTVKFAFIGDPQRSRNETVEFCDQVNSVADIDLLCWLFYLKDILN